MRQAYILGREVTGLSRTPAHHWMNALTDATTSHNDQRSISLSNVDRFISRMSTHHLISLASHNSARTVSPDVAPVLTSSAAASTGSSPAFAMMTGLSGLSPRALGTF